jgi:hypothetical protein
MEIGNLADKKRMERCIEKLLEQYQYDIDFQSMLKGRSDTAFRVMVNGFVQLTMNYCKRNELVFFEWTRLSDRCQLFVSEQYTPSKEMVTDVTALFLCHLEQYSGNPIKKCRGCQEPAIPDDDYCYYCIIEVSEYGEVCAICLDEQKKRDKWVITPCSHIFHRDCIEAAIAHKDSCPLCRTECKKGNWKVF